MTRPLFSYAGLLLLALLVRLALLALGGLNAPLTGDELQYQQLAQNLAAGRGFVQDNNPFFPGQTLYAWQAPLYPLTLGAVYALFGPQPLIGKLCSILLGVAAVYLTVDLARRTVSIDAPVSGSRSGEKVAWAAGLVVALYPGLATESHLLLSENLFICLLLLGLDLLAAGVSRLRANRSRGYWFLAAAGLASGAAVLTRGLALYLLPLFAIWLALVLRQSAQRAVLAIVILLVLTAAVIAPWTFRNYAVFHQIVLLETKGGVNFWLGNNPYTPDRSIRNVWKSGVREPMLAALPGDEAPRDRAGYALGLGFIREAPGTFLARIPIKFGDFWGFERDLQDAAEATRAGQGGWNSPGKLAGDIVSAAALILLVLLAIGGLVASPDDRWKLLLGGLVGIFISAHVVVFGDGRFHLPLIPILALYAARFAVYRFPAATTQRWRAAIGVLLALGLTAIWLGQAAAALSALTS